VCRRQFARCNSGSLILSTTSSECLAAMLFRFVIPISSGEVGIDSVGKFLRNVVIKLSGS
jgi:hypothetical protein